MRHKNAKAQRNKRTVFIVFVVVVILSLIGILLFKKSANNASDTAQGAKAFVSQFYDKYNAEAFKEAKQSSLNFQSASLRAIIQSNASELFYNQYRNTSETDYGNGQTSQNPVTCSGSTPQGSVTIKSIDTPTDGSQYELTISEPTVLGGIGSYGVEVIWDSGFKLNQVYC
jgi:hypothetical protein